MARLADLDLMDPAVQPDGIRRLANPSAAGAVVAARRLWQSLMVFCPHTRVKPEADRTRSRPALRRRLAEPQMGRYEFCAAPPIGLLLPRHVRRASRLHRAPTSDHHETSDRGSGTRLRRSPGGSTRSRRRRHWSPRTPAAARGVRVDGTTSSSPPMFGPGGSAPAPVRGRIARNGSLPLGWPCERINCSVNVSCSICPGQGAMDDVEVMSARWSLLRRGGPDVADIWSQL
jgi:hypothetical protein